MRIDRYQKQAIVSAIFQDVPKPDNNLIKRQAQEALVAAMSPLARELYVTSPRALASECWSTIFDRQQHRLIVGDADSEEVLKPWSSAKNAYDAAKRSLTSAIESCTSLKQLHDRLPEFAAYFPTKDAPAVNLPAIANLVTDLMKLGWKGATK
jgi:hypothetical protein